MTKVELQEKIAKLEKGIKSDTTPASYLPALKAKKEQYEKELKELEAKKEEPKKAEKPAKKAEKPKKSAPALQKLKEKLKKVAAKKAEPKKKVEPAKKEEPKKKVSKPAAKPATSGAKKVKEILAKLDKKAKDFNKGRSAAAIIRDADHKGKKAGKRISASGKTYYENRPNRVDMNVRKKPYLEKGGYMADGGMTEKSEAMKFKYMMLSRLKSDNEYYLGYGKRSPRVLWAGNVDDQISEMKKLWNELPKDKKPEWLSMEDILQYEKEMKGGKMASGGYMADGGELESKINHINNTYDGVVASKTYSSNRIQVVSPYFNTLSEIKKKEFDNSGLMERYGNTNQYVLYSNKSYMADGGDIKIGDIVELESGQKAKVIRVEESWIGVQTSNNMLKDVYKKDVKKLASGGYMADGGMMEEGVDLFEDYENIPEEVQNILDKYAEELEGGDYRDLEKVKKKLEKIGYTYEYYLDGTPYDLRKIGQKGKSEIEEDEFARGGYNYGRSWSADRARYNKKESWEVPMGQRKLEFGGDVEDEYAKGGQVYGDFKIKVEKISSPYNKDYKGIEVKVDKDGVPLKYVLQALVDFKDKEYLNQVFDAKGVQVFVKMYTRYVPLGFVSKNTYNSYLETIGKSEEKLASGGYMADGGMNKISLKDAFRDFISSGTIANWTGEEKYENLDEIRLRAMEIAPSSAEYSIEAAKEIANIAKKELEGGFMARGGYNYGRSWSADRARFNKNEDWEIPMWRRIFAEGGEMGKNMNVFGYETKHFDVCPIAVKEFEAAIAQLNEKATSEAEKEDLAKTAEYVDKVFAIEKGASSEGYEEAVNHLMTASMYNYRSGMLVNLFSFMPMHLDRIHEAKHGLKKKLAKGGGVDDCGCDEYAEGGEISIEAQNKDMLLNYAEEIEHHVKEFEVAAKNAEKVMPWVVAKMERASTDLADVTHYLESENEKRREYENGEGEEYGNGGEIYDNYDDIDDFDRGGEVREFNVMYFNKITTRDGSKMDVMRDRDVISGSLEKVVSKALDGFNPIDDFANIADRKNGTIIARLMPNGKGEVFEDGYGLEVGNIEVEQEVEEVEEKPKKKLFGLFAEGGELGVDKDRIYFSSFAEVMEAIYDIAEDNGYEVKEIFPDLSYGGVGYGQTKRAKVELEWNGKEKRGKSKKRETNTLNVQIYRMDSGNYELNTYFSYEDGGKMAEGGEVNWKKAVTIKRNTKDEAEKNAKQLAEYYGKSGRNFKVEKRDDKYVVTYEFNLTDKLAEGGGVGRIVMIPTYVVKEIKESVEMGYDTLVEGMIGRKRKGVALINEDYQVRGTYDLGLKDVIEDLIKKIKAGNFKVDAVDKMAEGGIAGDVHSLTDKLLSQKIQIFIDKVQPIKYYYIDDKTNSLIVGLDENYTQDAADRFYKAATSSMEFFDADSVDMKYISETGDTQYIIKLKKPVKFAKGGMNKISVWEKNGFTEYPRISPQEWQLVEWSFNGHSPSFKGKMYFQKGTGFMFIEKEDGEIYKPKSSNKLFWRPIKEMAKGGKVTFEDKVKAIKSSLLKRKKVSPKVQKDYGKTYSPKEAEESAKRIVGAMTAKERLLAKMKKRKK